MRIFFFVFLICTSALAEEVTTEVIGRRPLRRAPKERSELTGETLEIKGSPERTLPQILKHSTAITVRQSGGEGTAPEFMVRGQDPVQNRYFLEGVPLTDAEFNSANLGLLPVEALGKVDIYPEGTPLFLGEDGLGGALQFHLDDSTQPSVGTRFGSYGYTKAYGRVAGVHADFNQSREDFYFFDDNGTPFNPEDDSLQRREHNRFRRATLLPHVDLYRNETTRLRFLDLAAYGEIDVPGSIEVPSDGRLKTLYELAALKLETEDSDSHVYFRIDSQSLKNQTPAVSPVSFLSDSKAVSLGGRTRWRFGPFEAMGGTTVDRYSVESTAVEADRTAKTRLQIPIGVGARLPVDETYLIVKPAVLGHYYHYELGGASAFGELPPRTEYFLASPRLGVESYPLSFMKLRVVAGRYHRAPSMAEMYGAPTGVTPATALTYEQAWKGEAGVDLDWRNFRASYTYSRARARDLITYVQNSQQTQVAQNIGESDVKTHEVALEARGPLDLSLRAGVSWITAINLSDSSYQFGMKLPNRPDYRGDLAVSYGGRRLGVTYTLSLLGPTFWDVANLKQLSSTSEHSIFVSYDTTSIGIFVLELRNLGDVTTASSSYGNLVTIDNTTGYLGYPAPGRRVYLSWKYEI